MLKLNPILLLVLLSIFTSIEATENWGYEANGFDWSDTCKSGVRQSPLNINPSEVGNCKVVNPSISLTFKNMTVKSVLKAEDQTLRDSLTEQVAFLTAPDLNGVTQSYILSNFHFHTYSEHQINSVQHKLEMHMVFKTANPVTNDSIAVVGVMFEPATTKAQMQKPELELLKILSFKTAEEEEYINFADLFDGLLNAPGNKFYHYKGSLTTPPCSEIVNWYVLDRVIYMNPEDYQPFYNWFFNEEFSHKHGNFRIIQNTNGRVPCIMRIPDGNSVNLYLKGDLIKPFVAVITVLLSLFLL